ncbi:hypothetical protein, partial [Vibrio vulnificus]|uniref:hypothetical protein n=1 Tax=Vibrio vulnificus TaxID=672 RepID=UPI0039B48887
NGYAKVSFHLDPKLISKLKYGLINTIGIDALSFTDSRFNIPLPTKNIPEKIEILSNDYAFELGLTDKRPGVKGELLFLDENDNSEVSLDGS